MNKLVITAFLSASLVVPLASAQVLGANVAGQAHGQAGLGLAAQATAPVGQTGTIVRDEARSTASTHLKASEQAQASVAAHEKAAENSAVPTATSTAATTEDAQATGSANADAGLATHASATGVSASADGQATAAAASSSGGDAAASHAKKPEHPAGKKGDATP